jgi:hypothetical protein
MGRRLRLRRGRDRRSQNPHPLANAREGWGTRSRKLDGFVVAEAKNTVERCGLSGSIPGPILRSGRSGLIMSNRICCNWRLFGCALLIAGFSYSAGAADGKPEEIVAKHLDSIGTAEARAAIKSRVV